MGERRGIRLPAPPLGQREEVRHGDHPPVLQRSVQLRDRWLCVQGLGVCLCVFARTWSMTCTYVYLWPCAPERNPRRPPLAYLIEDGAEPLTFTNVFPQWSPRTPSQVRPAPSPPPPISSILPIANITHSCVNHQCHVSVITSHQSFFLGMDWCW